MKLLPPAHSETATKRCREQTCGSTLSFFGTRVQHCWKLRGRRPAANAVHCGTSNSFIPSRSCAARLAAPRHRDAVSFTIAFTIVVATAGCLSLIMGKTSAQLALMGGHTVRTALLKPRPPKRQWQCGNFLVKVAHEVSRDLQNISPRHCHTLSSWVLANCSTTSGLNTLSYASPPLDSLKTSLEREVTRWHACRSRQLMRQTLRDFVPWFRSNSPDSRLMAGFVWALASSVNNQPGSFDGRRFTVCPVPCHLELG